MWLFGLLLLGVWGVAEELKLSADAKKKSKLHQEYEELFDFVFRKDENFIPNQKNNITQKTIPVTLPQQNDTELTQKEAKAECLPIQETMVYKTPHGSCYHKSNCKWVYNKKDIITLTISNAKLCKFSPCKECFENENI